MPDVRTRQRAFRAGMSVRATNYSFVFNNRYPFTFHMTPFVPLSPVVLMQLCSDLYANKPDTFDHVWNFSYTIVGHKRIGDVDVIVPRGSYNWFDWLRNIEAVPIIDPNIGPIHAGMNVGIIDLVSKVAVSCGDKIVVTGHSLGGGRARLFCADLAHAGRPALQCTVFGAPHSMFAQGCQILRDSPTILSSFRNMSDPVPTVPNILRWEHPDLWSNLSAEASPGDNDILFRYHHANRYLAGLQSLYKTA